jgi:hypothetical protein
MFERREDEAERPERPRQPEPAPTADARLTALLQLQRTAGNQAVARRLLHRAQVEGTITETGQKHHPRYQFKFPGDEDRRTYDIDAWHTGKKNAQGPTGHAATLNRQQILDVINRWDASSSIVDGISDTFVGTPVWTEPQGTRKEGDITTGAITVHDNVAQSEDGQLFAQHFLALKHNLARRQDDMSKNLVQMVKVGSSRKVPKTTPPAVEYELDWTNLMKNARLRLKPLLANASKPPDWQDGITLIDDVMLAGQSGNANIEKLREYGLVYNNAGKVGFRKTNTVGNKNTGWTYEVKGLRPAKDVDFVFGLGHLRVSLYYEWRAVWEILTKAQQPAQVVVPQPVVAQPLAPVQQPADDHGSESEDEQVPVDGTLVV